MTAFECLDLEVQVARNVSGELEVQVLDSPRDRPRSPFKPSLTAAEAEELPAALAQWIRSEMTGEAAEGSLDLEHTGTQLFETLFPEPLRTTLEASLDRRTEFGGLRLRIGFDPKEKDLVPYTALPWEVLFHPARRQFLSRLPEVAVVRYLDVPVDIHRLFVSPPLRVLLIAPDPEDCTPTNVRQEQELVYQTLEATPAIEVDRVEPPTLERLAEVLATRSAHVVHFMGHGGYHHESGQSGVYFEGPDRKKVGVVGWELAARLEPFFSTLKLVVLNSCYGAAGRWNAGQEAFGSVTSELIASGLTAVVGMQFLISNDAAKCFARTFYERLAGTGHVEIAAAAARLELYEAATASAEWITPVVVTRAASGRLFDPDQAPDPEKPWHVGVQSFVGWGAEVEHWSHSFLPLTSYFRDRYLKQEYHWNEDVFPRLRRFLNRSVVGRRKIHLDFPAHQSIAFAIGWVLEAKAGMEIIVRQRGAAGTFEWSLAGPEPPPAWEWEIDHGEPDPMKPDVALAISPTRSVRTSVEKYVEEQLPTVGRIVEFRAPKGPSQLAVRDGWHAFHLAGAINHEMHELTPGDSKGTFHVFYSGPNGLFFFLGRLSRGPRKIQLYEYDFDGRGTKAYSPSLSFPPPE